MASPAPPSPQELLEIARSLGVSRGSVEAQLKMADRDGELDIEPTLDALRALAKMLARLESGEPG